MGAVSSKLIPRSSASSMVRIAPCSSVPPQPVPPIAHVPNAMRDTLRFVPEMYTYSIEAPCKRGLYTDFALTAVHRRDNERRFRIFDYDSDSQLQAEDL